MTSKGRIDVTPHGLWQRLTACLRRTPPSTAEKPRRMIQVYDAGRDTYRFVDLDNPNDSLWPVAQELARLREAGRANPAA